jgi:hypothetical protein
MTNYSENYLKLQRLMKSYHNATLKCDYEKATQLAHELSEETIKLEFATYDQVRKLWLS